MVSRGVEGDGGDDPCRTSVREGRDLLYPAGVYSSQSRREEIRELRPSPTAFPRSTARTARMSIREEVSEVEGVDEVDVDLETKVVTIRGSAARRRRVARRDRRGGLRGRMTATESPEARVELALEGMTCAACATRIERKLNKLEGVEASVNYATEQAAVTLRRRPRRGRRSHRRGRGGRLPRARVGGCRDHARIAPGRCAPGSSSRRR